MASDFENIKTSAKNTLKEAMIEVGKAQDFEELDDALDNVINMHDGIDKIRVDIMHAIDEDWTEIDTDC